MSTAHLPAREMCIASHDACERAGTPVAFRTPAAIVGGLLKQMSAESAATFLDVAARTAHAIANEVHEVKEQTGS